MKKLIITLIIALLTVAGVTARAEAYPEEYLGLPGDNLNLYAVMKLFQESATLEEFERSLNDENSRINNLDLNGDNFVDYIMVHDYVDGDVHNIVLRVALNVNENQDVAVFTVQRFGDGSVQIQLIGDEALYGRNYIIEPIYADSQNETPNPGYTGRVRTRSNVTVVHTTTYEVATWPLIRFIFFPGYVTWHSSWYWGYRPYYWNPWRPYYWHTYYGYHYHWQRHYYNHYRHWHHHRYSRYNDFYYRDIRSYSPKIKIKIKEGRYRSTYSRPDLRNHGTELYAMDTRNGKAGRAVTSGVRRSGSQSLRTDAKSGTRAVNQRRTTTVTGKSATRNSVNSKTANTRRSSATINNRANTTANNKGTQTVRRSTVNTGRNNLNSRPAASNTRRSNVSTRPATVNKPKPVTSVNKKSSSNYSGIQGTSRRPSGTVTGRTANRPSSGRATVKSGTTRSSAVKRSPVRSSAGRSTSISQKSSRPQSPKVTTRPSTSSRSSVSRGNYNRSSNKSAVTRSSSTRSSRSAVSRGSSGRSSSSSSRGSRR